MIAANELRIGNLVIWNPKLSNPDSTLPAIQVEVFSIWQDKISYVFPNIENRVEPFEDDVAQLGNRYKLLEELEPVSLTNEILYATGFTEKEGPSGIRYFENGELQLKPNDHFFQRVLITELRTETFHLSIQYFHQLQNLYFALTGEELEIKLHGQA